MRWRLSSRGVLQLTIGAVYGERGFYGFSLGISTLPFLALLVGAVIGFLGFSVWNKLYLEKRFDRSHDGTIAPELRLPPAIVAAPCYPICLFWFAWSAGRTHWIVPVIGSTFFGIGTSLAFQSVLNYLPDGAFVALSPLLATILYGH